MKEVAVAIIRHDNRILVCQRPATARYPLKWEFPGGKLEQGESPKVALQRELKEELDIEAQIGSEFHRQEWTYSEGTQEKNSDSSFRVFYFNVTQFRGTPVNRAFRDIQWVSPDDLTEIDMLEGNRETVNLLLRNAKTESS